jgi:hypothetical protein
MKVKESKNLKWDKRTNPPYFPDDYERMDLRPEVCFLDGFKRMKNNLILDFKNVTQAVIRAKNQIGERELVEIEEKLQNMIGMSYQSILEMEI